MNPSEEKAKAPEKTKALCVATRCTTVEQFVATFHRFCDESSFFVATLATRPVGLETAFSIQLEDKTPVLRGLCVVVEAWATPANRFGRPGVRLNVRRLTNESLPVFKQLQAARIAAEAAEKEKAKADEAKPVEVPAVVPRIESTPVTVAPKIEARAETKAPEKPKSLSEKLAEIKSQPKPPAIPPRKTDGIPPIPLPKINPTAFAVKPPNIDEPTKIEAKTAVRAEGTAPVTRAEIDPPKLEAKADAKLEAKIEAKADAKIEAKADAKSDAKSDAKVEAKIDSPKPKPRTTPIVSTEEPTVTERVPVASTSATSAPTTTTSAHTITSATSAPMDAPSRPTPPPRAANVTTPAIGISTSTINLSNAAQTAEDTHAHAPPYPDTASIVDAPPKPDAPTPAIDAPLKLDAPIANPDAPEAIAASDDMTSPVASESRAPGSSFVLPANPLMNLSDKSLEGFVDCALYEETGNFFRAPGYEDSLVDIDEVAAPPGVLAPTPAIRPGDEVSQAAYVITPTPGYVAQQQQFAQQEMTGRNPTQPPYPTGQVQLPTGEIVPVQYPTGQMAPMQYPTGQMTPMQYPTGQMAPMQYPTYPTGQMPPLQTGTTNPPYAVHAPPQDSTAALLAMSAPSRRRWMIIGGAAVFASVVLLVLVIATRGDDKTATAATTPATSDKNPSGEKVTMAVTAPVETPVARTPEPKAPTPVVNPDEEETTSGDPGSPPVVGSGPCELTVTTTPAGSIVRLDDQVVGPSPITIQSTCSRKRVDVKHPRYAPGVKWVNLAANKPASVDIRLSRPTHRVTVISQPAGATVSIAGRRAGTTPTAVQMMGFTKVALTIEKKGYKTVVESIYSKSDGERRTVTLTKAK